MIDAGDLVDLGDVVEGIGDLVFEKRKRRWRWVRMAIGLAGLGLLVALIMLD
jgi:hypothetical protein